jgi:mannose-6-phosphate isomerase
MAGEICPLVFEPIYRTKVWGGRNLARLFGRALPSGAIGESWECVDLEKDVSIVGDGPARGRSLAELIAEWGPDLYGRAPLVDGRFPLLIKYLDAMSPLSIQVHPDDATAARLGRGARPKHEVFYVIEAQPEACIYRGLRAGVTRDDLAAALGSGEIEKLVQRIPVRAGHAFDVPPGTVHALGAGVVVAEIETPSDTTYRLYDWGRSRPAGDAGLHVEQALASIRFDAAAPAEPPRSHVGSAFTTVTRLAECEHFVVEKVRFIEGMEMEIPYAEPVVWIVLEGRGAVLYGRGGAQPFRPGDVLVLPAALKDGKVKTETDCIWLEVTVPVRSDLADHPRPDPRALRAPEGTPGSPLTLNVSVRPRDP